MDPHALYGPFAMQVVDSHLSAPKCQVCIQCPTSRLCRAWEKSVENETTGVWDCVLVFPLAAAHKGHLVHIELDCSDAVSAPGPLLVTARRTTNGEIQAVEQREVVACGAHTLSSVYIRGVERIHIECSRPGDAVLRHTILIIEFRVSQF